MVVVVAAKFTGTFFGDAGVEVAVGRRFSVGRVPEALLLALGANDGWLLPLPRSSSSSAPNKFPTTIEPAVEDGARRRPSQQAMPLPLALPGARGAVAAWHAVFTAALLSKRGGG